MDVSQRTSSAPIERPASGAIDSGPMRGVDVLRKRLVPFILHHRWWTFITILLVSLLLEVAEQFVSQRYGARAHVTFDIVLYLLVIPSSAYMMIALLERNKSELEQATYAKDWQSEFSQKLGDSASWDELVEAIVVYPHRLAPQAEVVLYVNQPSGAPRAEAVCGKDGVVKLKPPLPVNPDTIPLGSLRQILLQNNGLHPASAADSEPPSAAAPGTTPAAPNATTVAPNATPVAPLPPNRYDLPVTRGGQQIGVLKLRYPPGGAPSQAEVRALKGAAPLIALALEGALLQNLAAGQAAASEAERQQIAQNLHDTLAQNVGYLRLKLDQLTGEHAIREIGVVLQELERMRAAADEAYQQVRNTLDELNPVLTDTLTGMITKQAQAISHRAGISLHLNQMGAPYQLPAAAQQHIIYMAREALHNVEKHAQASEVHVQFLWLENELILKIADNGIGFDPAALPTEGHYGLWIMQQRAQEIGGTLMIAPASEKGTEVTLWVPRLAASAPAETAD